MSLYLSRLTLDRSAPTSALIPLLDPANRNAAADAHHRLIWSAFSDDRNRKRDFLWRHIGRGRFLTLSRRPPQANGLFAPPETRVFDPQLAAGDRLQFSLRANATRARLSARRLTPTASLGRGRRVDVVADLLHATPAQGRAGRTSARAAAQAWLRRQGLARGFSLNTVMLENYSTVSLRGRRHGGGRIGILDLSGVIEVTDPRRFRSALAFGIGRAKAWGCGLMLIRRAR